MIHDRPYCGWAEAVFFGYNWTPFIAVKGNQPTGENNTIIIAKIR
jgi:hypothetical protein